MLQRHGWKSQTKDDNLIKTKEIAKHNFVKGEPFLNIVFACNLRRWNIVTGEFSLSYSQTTLIIPLSSKTGTATAVSTIGRCLYN
jgi:hypothetical protein